MFFRKSHKEASISLINRYKKTGEVSVLGELYEPHMEWVFAVCVKYLKNEMAAEDAVMQIFEKLVEALKKHEIENFESWLHSLARNHCLMQLRKQPTGQKVELTDHIPDHFMEFENLEHLIEKEATLQRLEACIEQLNAEQKQTIQLFYQKEKCYQEISELTGFPLKKVKSYLQNGRRNLKNCVENSA